MNTMKFKLIGLFFFLVSWQVSAQKFGYIDSEYITSKMPGYQAALASMNQWTDQWVKEVQTKQQAWESLQQKFKQEEILLTEDLKKIRLQEIADKELEWRNFNQDIFGMEGKLFQKKKELMKPVLDEVYKACEKVARQKQLMFIFDKASDLSMIYTDPRHDYTDFVLEALGLGSGPIKK